MKRWRRSSIVVVGSALAFVVVGGLLLIWVPEALLRNWLPNGTNDDRSKLLGVAAQVVLIGLGGVIASVGVTLSIMRHREELEGAERDRARFEFDNEKEKARREESDRQHTIDIERELRARFVTAIDLLSAPEPVKRSGAIFSLGALADDWAKRERRDEVQVCIHVLCSYLRAPLGDGVLSTPLDEVEVRTVGYRLIRHHIDRTDATAWGSYILDLSGAFIDFPVFLMNAQLRGKGVVDLSNTKITGDGGFEIIGDFHDESAVLAIGMEVDGPTVILSGDLRGSGRIESFGVSVAEGVFGIVASLGDEASVDAVGLLVKGGGKALLKINEVVDNKVEILNAEYSSASIQITGATPNEFGKVTMPDGLKYSPASS